MLKILEIEYLALINVTVTHFRDAKQQRKPQYQMLIPLILVPMLL